MQLQKQKTRRPADAKKEPIVLYLQFQTEVCFWCMFVLVHDFRIRCLRVTTLRGVVLGHSGSMQGLSVPPRSCLSVFTYSDTFAVGCSLATVALTNCEQGELKAWQNTLGLINGVKLGTFRSENAGSMHNGTDLGVHFVTKAAALIKRFDFSTPTGWPLSPLSCSLPQAPFL